MIELDVIPELNSKQEKFIGHIPRADEQKRGRRVQARIDSMLLARSPYEAGMRRGLLLYDGVLLLDTKQTILTNDNLVSPYARMFVEAKTAEEVAALSDYTFTPVEDSGDSWKVDLLKDVNTHVRKKMKMKSKKHSLVRMKNIMGVSIARVGYRRIMGLRKIRIEDDENGEMLKWKEVPIPVYDDLFFDVVSPFNFAIDPNATSMDDAMDCVHFHCENYEVFWETYHNDKKFYNTENVKAGVSGKYSGDAFTRGGFRGYADQENMVWITEYFNKLRDEWCVYANGIEIYYGPLPDDHKELPFVSYHNNPSFCTGYVESSILTADGNAVASNPTVRSEDTFWTQGDPQTIMDLIELRTLHGRAAHRAMKRASQVIIATDGNFQLPSDQKWMDGAQAKGAKGKLEILPLGIANTGNWEWAQSDLFQQMILALGIDPRSLADTKAKTALETSVQRETAMKRLMENMEFNEENGELRLGMLIHKLIQQRYTKPEIVRITGTESEEDIGRFDEIEKDADTGIPIYGKRYRRIKSSLNMVESSAGKHLTLSKDDSGVSSFLSRPEYIRTSEIDISVDSSRSALKIQAVELQQAMEGIQLFIQLIPLAQADPITGQSVISKEDLPNLKKLVESYIKARGLPVDQYMGTGEKKDDTDKKVDEFEKTRKMRRPITEITQPLPVAV